MLQDTFRPACNDTHISSLSWGLPEELLIGGSSLTLLWTDNVVSEQWTKRLANRSKFCAFSHDASLIASTGWHDRLVKIWRRLFIGGGDERFDAAYLAHPGTVTSVRWRGRPNEHLHQDAVLYTTCVDQHLRVWTASDPHCIQILDLWTAIDLVQCIQPESPLSPLPFKSRWVVMIDSWDFKTIVERFEEITSDDERQLHARQHLLEVASQCPEVCIVMDDQDNMSAWCLEHIGCKAQQERDVFNFAHAQELSFGLSNAGSSTIRYAQLTAFQDFDSSGKLHFLANRFDGSLQWLRGSADRLFDPSPQSSRLQTTAVLTGHAEVIAHLTCSSDASHLLSTGVTSEAIVWRITKDDDNLTLERRSVVRLHSSAHGSVLSSNAEFAAFLHSESISFWDVRHPHAKQVALIKFDLEPNGSALILLPMPQDHSYLLVVLSSAVEGQAWQVHWRPDQSGAEFKGQVALDFEVNGNANCLLSSYQPCQSQSSNGSSMQHCNSTCQSNQKS